MTPAARRTALLVVAALAAGSCSLPGAKQGPMKVTAVFSDVGDLVVDHSVQVADVRVGSVTKIELTADYKAKVTMSVQRLDLPADAIAELRTTSLLGEKFIQLRKCDPKVDGAVCTGTTDRLRNGANIPPERSKEAPELEFVAQQAVELLAGNLAQDFSTLVETGSVGFGGRGGELRALVGDLSTISATLADQTRNIVGIIEGLDKASSTLAASSPDVEKLLSTLSETTSVLAANRDQAVKTVQALTRLAQAQNQLVFDPYINQVNLQIKQLDAILGVVAAGRAEVANLLDWVTRFAQQIPRGIPNHYAQVYGWFAVCPTSGC